MENPNLPDEIVIEIFSRLPAKSVGKCRCLSKSWRTNLSTSQFVNLHLGRQKDSSTILLLREGCIHPLRTPPANDDDDDDSFVLSRKLDFPDLSVDAFLGSCNGLVLLSGDMENDILLVNPLTLEQVRVQNRPLSHNNRFRVLNYGFGYDSCSYDYKIVKLSRSWSKIILSDDPYPPISVDVYSLRKGVFKRLNTSYFHDNDIIIGRGRGVLLNGAIHWSAFTRITHRTDDSWYAIVAFDFATESFRGIPAPTDFLNRM